MSEQQKLELERLLDGKGFDSSDIADILDCVELVLGGNP